MFLTQFSRRGIVSQRLLLFPCKAFHRIYLTIRFYPDPKNLKPLLFPKLPPPQRLVTDATSAFLLSLLPQKRKTSPLKRKAPLTSYEGWALRKAARSRRIGAACPTRTLLVFRQWTGTRSRWSLEKKTVAVEGLPLSWEAGRALSKQTDGGQQPVRPWPGPQRMAEKVTLSLLEWGESWPWRHRDVNTQAGSSSGIWTSKTEKSSHCVTQQATEAEVEQWDDNQISFGFALFPLVNDQVSDKAWFVVCFKQKFAQKNKSLNKASTKYRAIVFPNCLRHNPLLLTQWTDSTNKR